MNNHADRVVNGTKADPAAIMAPNPPGPSSPKSSPRTAKSVAKTTDGNGREKAKTADAKAKAKGADEKAGADAIPDDPSHSKRAKNALTGFKDKIVANAAVINEQVAEKAAQLKERIQSSDSDDDDDDDTSDDDNGDNTLFGEPTASQTTDTTVAASATAVRGQPPPSFISLEEEAEVKEQLAAAKALRKKLRKLKRTATKCLGTNKDDASRLCKLLTSMQTASESPFTDANIQELASTSAANVAKFQEAGVAEGYQQRTSGEFATQVKLLTDHSKYLTIVGKERRQARDKRIKLSREEVDAADEAAYLRSQDVVKDFEDKSAAYREEYHSLVEHNSSQVGQMLKCLLMESAGYYEQLAKTLRDSANSVAANPSQFMSEDVFAHFRTYEPPKNPAAAAAVGAADGTPVSASSVPVGGAHTQGKDMSLGAAVVKPSAFMRDDAVAGIPLADPHAPPSQPPAYGASTYTVDGDGGTAAAKAVSRTTRAVDQFLQTGVVPESPGSVRRPRLPTPTLTAMVPTRPQASDGFGSRRPSQLGVPPDNGSPLPRVASTREPASLPPSMPDIRELDERYGISWPCTPLDDYGVTAARSTRSLTPDSAAMLPSITRSQQPFGSLLY